MIDKSRLTFKNRKEELKKEAAIYEEKIIQNAGRWALIVGGAYLGLQILKPYLEHKLFKNKKVVPIPEVIPNLEKEEKKNKDKPTSSFWRATLTQQLKEQVVGFVQTQALSFLVNNILKKDEQQNTGADKKAKKRG